MVDKSLPQVQGVGNIDNLVHLWVKIRNEQFVSLCDPELHAESVAKSKKGDLCPVCVNMGLKEPQG